MIVCKNSARKTDSTKSTKESSKQKSAFKASCETKAGRKEKKTTKFLTTKSIGNKKNAETKCSKKSESSNKKASKKVVHESKAKAPRNTINGWVSKTSSSTDTSSLSSSSSASSSPSTVVSSSKTSSSQKKSHSLQGGIYSNKGLCLFCQKPPKTKDSSQTSSEDKKKIKKKSRTSKKEKAIEFLRKKTSVTATSVGSSTYNLNPVEVVKRTFQQLERSSSNSSRVYRMASLNALAKVHILYESDTRTPGSDSSSDGDSSGAVQAETNGIGKRSESTEGHSSKQIGKSDKKSSKGSSGKVDRYSTKIQKSPQKLQKHPSPSQKSSKTKKKTKVKIIPKKRKLDQVEIIDTRSCKRMANLNAQAIMAASLTTERQRKDKKNTGDEMKPGTTIAVRVTVEKEEKIEQRDDDRSTVKKVSSCKVKENIQVRTQHSPVAASDAPKHDDLKSQKKSSNKPQEQSLVDATSQSNCQLRSLTSSTSESTRTVASKVGLTTEYREVTKVHINTTKEMEVKEEGQPSERILEKDDVAITRMYHYQSKATSQSYCLQMHTSYKPVVNETYSPPPSPVHPAQSQQQIGPSIGPMPQPVMHNNQNYYNYPAPPHSNMLPSSAQSAYPMTHGIGEVANVPLLSVGPIPRHYGSAFSVPHYGHPPTMPYAHSDYGYYQPPGTILQPIHDPCLIHKPVPFHPQQHHPHPHHLHAQPSPHSPYPPGEQCLSHHPPAPQPAPCPVDPQTPRYPTDGLQRNTSRQSAYPPPRNVAAAYHCQSHGPSQGYPTVPGFPKDRAPTFQIEGRQENGPPSQQVSPTTVPTTVPKAEPVTPPEPVARPSAPPPHQTIVTPLSHPVSSTREPNGTSDQSRTVHLAMSKGDSVTKQATCQALSTTYGAVKRTRNIQSEDSSEKKSPKSSGRGVKFQNQNNSSSVPSSKKSTKNSSVSSVKANNEKNSSLVSNKKNRRVKNDTAKVAKKVIQSSSGRNSPQQPYSLAIAQQQTPAKKCLQPKVSIQRLLIPKKKRLCVGWTWEGKPQDKLVFLSNDDPPCVRPCYPAMRHTEGDVIRVRDCVLLKSGPRKTDLPFVAKVAALWENPEDNEMMMSLLWYYRPEHTDQGRLPHQREDELYASKHRDVNSVACIEDKCYVLTFAEYCRYRGKVRMLDEGYVRLQPSVVPEPEEFYPRRERLPPGKMSPEMVFFCRKVYDFRQKRILKNPT